MLVMAEPRARIDPRDNKRNARGRFFSSERLLALRSAKSIAAGRFGERVERVMRYYAGRWPGALRPHRRGRRRRRGPAGHASRSSSAPRAPDLLAR